MKNILIKASLLFAGVIAALLLAESVSRFFTHSAINYHTPYFKYDSILGWSKAPNASAEYRCKEFNTVEYFNSKGIRGSEYLYEKKDNERRILVLGDSFAEGYTVPFEDLFSEKLKNKLNQKAQLYYEVINAGTSGYSTDQEYLFFINEGWKYNPDLVILMFYDNDVIDNSRDKGAMNKPYFVLSDNDLILKNTPVPKQYPPLSAAYFAEWIRVKSALYNCIRTFVKKNPLVFRLFGKTDKLHANNCMFDFAVYSKTQSEQLKACWALTEVLLRQFKTDVESRGAAFLIFYVPSRESVYERYWRKRCRKYGMRDMDFNIYAISEEIEKMSNKLGIDCVNPIIAFHDKAQKLDANNNQLYFDIDGHWNSLGHELVSDILFSYINLRNSSEVKILDAENS